VLTVAKSRAFIEKLKLPGCRFTLDELGTVATCPR
jgi:hypothetical protein